MGTDTLMMFDRLRQKVRDEELVAIADGLSAMGWSGGGEGAVASVNGQTGVVALTPADVGAVPTVSTLTETPSAPLIRRNVNHALSPSDPNQVEFRVGDQTVVWQNEWGAWRGRPAAYEIAAGLHPGEVTNWVDSLFRAILEKGDPTGAGSRRNAFEVVDRRGPANVVLWGVQWDGGVMQQGGVDVGTIFMLTADQTVADIPDSLPKGTVVYQMQADPDEV